ncbi:MAG: Ig-like domain-containing protein [bacterium]|nr:Ig-like domain-containing protein [bacterium]
MKRLIILLTTMFAAAFAGQYDLLIGHSDSGSTSGVETNIGENPFYSSVTIEDWSTSTPTIDHLLDYGCVYTWSNYGYADRVGLGDRLADYVDQGGTVVINNFCWTSRWGLGGRIQTDGNYAPLTHNGNCAYSYTNLGSFDSGHPFMDGVSSITNIYYMSYVSKEPSATWVADTASLYPLCAVNADFNVAGINMFPGDARRWAGDGWRLYNNVIENLMMNSAEDTVPPTVEGLEPGDGDSGVPLDYTIVFHCVDDHTPVDADTIRLTVRDSTLRGDNAVRVGAAEGVHYDSSRVLAGDLDVDYTDQMDVVCTWTGDDPFQEGSTVTCTVDGGLADRLGNELGADFVWTFSTSGASVTETTWGAIKAEF